MQQYVTASGAVPFDDWIQSLKDRDARGHIKARLERVRLGNMGNCKPVGSGVYELRVDVGHGYRLYYAQINPTVLLLLCGSDKHTQVSDIRKAQEYWMEYQQEAKANEKND